MYPYRELTQHGPNKSILLSPVEQNRRGGGRSIQCQSKFEGERKRTRERKRKRRSRNHAHCRLNDLFGGFGAYQVRFGQERSSSGGQLQNLLDFHSFTSIIEKTWTKNSLDGKIVSILIFQDFCMDPTMYVFQK